MKLGKLVVISYWAMFLYNDIGSNDSQQWTHRTRSYNSIKIEAQHIIIGSRVEEGHQVDLQIYRCLALAGSLKYLDRSSCVRPQLT